MSLEVFFTKNKNTDSNGFLHVHMRNALRESEDEKNNTSWRLHWRASTARYTKFMYQFRNQLISCMCGKKCYQ